MTLSRLPDAPPEAGRQWDEDTNRASSRARRRAERRIAAMHPEQFAEALHEEKHRERLSHRHWPGNPETIEWWGEPS